MRIKIVFALLLVAALSQAQQLNSPSSSTTSLEETGIWNGLYLKVRLNDKIGYYAEHHYRVRNSLDDVTSFYGRTRQIYNRAGINIFFNKNFEAVIGPALVLNYTPQPGNDQYEKITYEPRIWHQWLFKTPNMGRFNIYHQFRFEHRWKRDNNVGDVHDYTNRYRYKFFAYVPINKPTITEKTLYFSPSAEIFMHTGSSIVYNPLEDFRTYNGFGYVLNNNVTFFVGHMWTLGQKSDGASYRSSHILRFNIQLGFDLRKLEKKLPRPNLGY